MRSTADDVLAIQQVLAAYCQHCDDGDFAGLAALFTPHGAFVYREQVISGREAIVAWFEVAQAPGLRGKHLTTNVVVDVEGDRARAVSDFLFLRRTEGALEPLVTGRYRDELVRRDDRWLIARRELEA